MRRMRSRPFTLQSLELKLPPPAVALVLALLMWGVARLTAPLPLSPVLRGTGGLLLFGAGLAVRVLAQASFVRAKTTISPLDPLHSAALVVSGVYRLSRNPMYLGRVLQLAGWAVWLASGPAALLVPVYPLVVTRLQVIPEERALQARFGEAYSAYCTRVPRWW